MAKKSTIILTDQEIKPKIKRIAYEIYENNVEEKEIILAGIAENGYLLAKKLKIELSKISQLTPVLCKVEIDKKKPRNTIKTSLNKINYTDKSIVLIDDVLNSGTTLIYAVKHFIEVPLKRFKTAVLVDRNHKKYPVKADFKGISLSTSLNEHISVNFDNNKFEAVLK